MQTKNILVLVTLTIFFSVLIADGSLHDKKSFNILIVLPPMRGHRTPVLNLARYLKDAGHSVTAFAIDFEGETEETNGVSGSEEARRAGFQLIESVEKFELPDPEVADDMALYDKLRVMPTFFAKQNLQTYRVLTKHYQNETVPKPDVVVYEIFMMGGGLVAKALDVPGVLLLPGLLTNTRYTHLNAPWLLMPKYREVPSLGMRLGNALSNVLGFSFFWYKNLFTRPELPKGINWPLTVDESLDEGHLVIITPLAPVLPPQPLLPLVQNVGPIIHSTKSSPNDLSKKLKDWLDAAADANESIVYVSFGSIFIPEKDTILNLTRGLSDLVQSGKYRAIWARGVPAFKASNLEVPVDNEKLLIEGFVPQQALLSYRNLVKAFVSHCGAGGTMESLAAGIPILALPLGIDQFVTAGRLEEAGLGIAMDATSLPSNEIVDNLKRLIHETGFVSAVKQQRAILDLAGGGPRAVQLIESVAISGNLMLLRAFDADWPWYSSSSLDILVVAYFLISTALALLGLVLFLVVSLCRSCFRKKLVKPKLE